MRHNHRLEAAMHELGRVLENFGAPLQMPQSLNPETADPTIESVA